MRESYQIELIAIMHTKPCHFVHLLGNIQNWFYRIPSEKTRISSIPYFRHFLQFSRGSKTQLCKAQMNFFKSFGDIPDDGVLYPTWWDTTLGAPVSTFGNILAHIGVFCDKRASSQHMLQYPHHSGKIRSGAKIGQKRGFLAKRRVKFSIFPKIRPHSPIALLARAACKFSAGSENIFLRKIFQRTTWSFGGGNFDPRLLESSAHIFCCF